MTDRALQDEVIRALADAGFRRSPGWRERSLAEPEPLERFARFLARNFYRIRVVHFFRYSRALARVTRRRPEAVVEGGAFERLLPSVVLGSRETAREVAALVVASQRTAPGAGSVPYLDDLLRYQEAMMVAEAGPRDWRGTDEPPLAPDEGVAEIAEGAEVVGLEHDIPSVLPALLLPWDRLPGAPRSPVRLLVARSRRGRVSVVVLTDPMEKVLALADGTRSLGEVTRAAGDGDLVGDLVNLGAIRVEVRLESRVWPENQPGRATSLRRP